ncbi:MAG TPA: SWIM zinc finger family protein [Streptosporangiaceae bacterium]|nr:SWIM zinc finger family protein [Streptosporangiaceae bacterium]HME66701.1 SWIM zinc finger family protein [Streptosporangiaceae bacterium]
MNHGSGGTGETAPGGPEFGRTWWGRAWLEALEQRARLDPDRLPRGRDYARSGAVGELTLAPGEARARVQGRKTEPYEVRIRVRRFTDDEWDRVLAAISARLGHAAALLDGELPPEIARDAAAAGLDLLPGGGELGPRCSCPDDADPCKHSAAACYLITDALDTDPFALFLLRGRTRDQVLAGIRARRRGTVPARAAGPGTEADDHADAGADEGVDARTAFGAPESALPIPSVPLPPRRPGMPAALPVDPPPWRSGLREDLVELAADAASRAWEMAVGLSADAGLGLDADADLARRAARALGTPAFGALAARSGVGERDLARHALAWRQGGLTGLDSLHAEWDPVADDPDAARLLTAARSALRIKTGAAQADIQRNRVTAGRLQLRLGRDLRWYPYARSDDGWEPSGTPEADPARALTDL